jgi:deoxycytidine triphosphate deaminase
MSIIDPHKAKKWVEGVGEGCIQQSGIDVRLLKIEEILDGGQLGIKTKRALSQKMMPLDGWFYLERGRPCIFECGEYVSIPKTCCALLIVRSSLNRIGAFVTTGLYDNGFHGYVGGVLRPDCTIKLEIGTPIAQLVFFESRGRNLYLGQYNQQRR